MPYAGVTAALRVKDENTVLENVMFLSCSAYSIEKLKRDGF
jgi:hypothetical protein